MDRVVDQVELTRIDADTLPAFLSAFGGVFAKPTSDEGVERFRRTVEYDRFLVARHGGAVVGTAGAYSFEMSLPWAAPAGCAGVSMVSVRADHRRRGLLTRMMAVLLDEAQDRGEPFAALWASEGPIYGRYGFGPAIPTDTIRVEREHGRFRVPADLTDLAGVELVDAEEAARRFPGIYGAVCRERHGTMSRNPAWWDHELADPSDRRSGAGAKRYAVLGARGYAIHRLRPSWEHGVPRGTVELQELVATDPGAHRAMWRFVIDTDLASDIVAENIPVDDPLSVLLEDPARSRRSHAWPAYLRLVDVPGALMARGYRTDDTLTLRVHDRFRPNNDGTWRLAVTGGRADCEASGQVADLELDATTLATVALGGVRVTSLAAAGAIVASTGDAVVRFERLLATDVAPWHGSIF
jgi:predicted acetyltransferase